MKKSKKCLPEDITRWSPPSITTTKLFDRFTVNVGGGSLQTCGSARACRLCIVGLPELGAWPITKPTSIMAGSVLRWVMDDG